MDSDLELIALNFEINVVFMKQNCDLPSRLFILDYGYGFESRFGVEFLAFEWL